MAAHLEGLSNSAPTDLTVHQSASALATPPHFTRTRGTGPLADREPSASASPGGPDATSKELVVGHRDDGIPPSTPNPAPPSNSMNLLVEYAVSRPASYWLEMTDLNMLRATVVGLISDISGSFVTFGAEGFEPSTVAHLAAGGNLGSEDTVEFNCSHASFMALHHGKLRGPNYSNFARASLICVNCRFI